MKINWKYWVILKLNNLALLWSLTGFYFHKLEMHYLENKKENRQWKIILSEHTIKNVVKTNSQIQLFKVFQDNIFLFIFKSSVFIFKYSQLIKTWLSSSLNLTSNKLENPI